MKLFFKKPIILILILGLLLENLIFVLPARAQFVPVFDPAVKAAITAATLSTNATTKATGAVTTKAKIFSDWARLAKDFALRVAVDFLVQRIIQKITQETLNWIQGGGKPAFVTNWEDLITDSANKAFGDVLRAYNAASLCSPGFFRVTQFLAAPPLERGITCTFTQTVGNYQNWVNNFRNGGWFGWQQYWQPQNNPYGQVLLAWDAQDRQAALKTAASTQEARAGQGFLSFKTCVAHEATSAGTSTTLAELPLTGSEPGCLKYDTLTPGQVVSRRVGDVLQLGELRLVNSQATLSASISAIVDAVLQKLINKGLALMSPSPSAAETAAVSAGAESGATAAAGSVASEGSSYGDVSSTINGITGIEGGLYNAGNQPTAILTANGFTNSITVNVGDVINYQWSSQTADSATSNYYVINGPDNCGVSGGNWVASTTSGSLSAPVKACQAGYTYIINYTATNSVSNKSANASITVKVTTSTSATYSSPASFGLP